MAKKSTDIIVYERVREVFVFMMNASKQRKDIVHFFSKKWTVDGYFNTNSEASKHRTIDIYIRKVKNTFFNIETEIQHEKGRALARLDDLYSKCIKIQDYKGALQIQKEINSMLGLLEPEKIEQTNINVSPKDWTE